MVKKFDNWNDLFKHLEQTVELNLPTVAQKIANILKMYVRENWYDKYEPLYYERTMDVLNSITVDKIKKNGNILEVEIYFDKNKIEQKESTFPLPEGYIRFHHHMSIDGSTTYGNMSIAEWVVYWMNYGQHSPLYSYDGVHFIEKTIEWTERDKYHIKKLKELLEQNGFRCTLR